MRWTRFRSLRRSRVASSAGLGALASAVVAALLGCIFVLPAYLVDRDLGARPKAQLPTKDLLQATNDVRTTLLQGLAGAFFLATAFFTWRQIRLGQRQVQLTEDQQIAERFTRAVEQLTSKSPNSRSGAVFGLERIAGDSDRDFSVVTEVLSGFVRERAPRASRRQSAWGATGAVPADVQAALTVLGRIGRGRDEPARLDLSGTDLQRANLRDADLRGALLNGANLTGARLDGADLTGARLVGADLSGASLRFAELARALMIDAVLHEAKVVQANLNRANLTGAKVDERSRLIKVSLEGATLRGVELARARWDGLSWDDDTTWPDGFVPTERADAEPPAAVAGVG